MEKTIGDWVQDAETGDRGQILEIERGNDAELMMCVIRLDHGEECEALVPIAAEPNYCANCDGRGGFKEKGECPECPGNSGCPMCYDSCPNCLGRGYCPRCGADVDAEAAWNAGENARCKACGFVELETFGRPTTTD